MVELADGVRLHIIPSTKFKTIAVKFKFKTFLDKHTVTKRSLLSRLLETNSRHYPTQTDFQNALSELYGANFGTNVSKKGNLHTVSVNMSIVNDKFLQEKGVLQEAMNFFHSVLYHPNAFNGSFHEETFIREKENLKDDFESIYDDKSAYASLAIQKLYFDQPEQQIPASGRIEDLDGLTRENVFEAYKSMIENDELDIYILGDVNKEEIVSLFKNFEFEDRQTVETKVFYKNENSTLKEDGETQEVAQAKLNMAYDTDIYYHRDNYYAGQVFNGLFGGFPHSKLFINVREKESLAYHASSQLDTFRGVMYVQTGIDKNDSEKVIKIISEQLEDIKQGNFSEEALAQTKEMIKNGLLQSEDSASSIIERTYALSLAGSEVSIDKWIEKIDQVTREDVLNVAQSANLRATFLLKGEDKVETDRL